MIDGVVQFDLPASGAGTSSSVLPSFVIGQENLLVAPPLERLLQGRDLAEAACLFNPLVLVGTTGSGKSQLAQAIVRHWSSRLDPSQAGYFTAVDFGRQLQAASAEDRLTEWRRSVRALRVLVIEDIDRLRPNATIQQELRHSLDAVTGSGGVAVVTAKREPIALRQLDAGLCDRLVAGLVVRLQRPGPNARQSIVRLAAAAKRVVLTDEQIIQFSRREVAAPGELLGLVKNAPSALLAHEAREQSSSRDPRLPRSKTIGRDAAMVDGAEPDAHPAPTLKQIIAVTARYFGVTQSALTGPSRRSSLVTARNIVVHLARRLTDLSYADIGRGIGGRDHTTAMHADRRINALLDRDPPTQHAVEELDRLLR